MSSVSIAVLNESLKLVMRRLSITERTQSVTDLNVSVGFKLTWCRFINSSVLLLIINWNNATNWFDAGGLAYETSLLMCIMAFGNPAGYLIKKWDPVKMAKKWYY